MSTSKQNIVILRLDRCQHLWADIDIRLSFNGGPCPFTNVDIRLLYIRLNIIEGQKRNWEVQEVMFGSGESNTRSYLGELQFSSLYFLHTHFFF